MTASQPRRDALRWTAAVAASVAMPSLMLRPSLAQTPRRLTPSQSEGPFYPDQSLQDADADLLKNGSTDYRQGEPAWLSGVVTDVDGKAVAGAQVEIWQCDHEGKYRHSSSSGNRAMAFQGFGKVQVGSDGRYRFRTIKPAPYTGRTPHIHVKVKLGSKELLTSQIYIAGESANERDGLFRRMSAADRSSLEAPFAKGSDGWQAEFGMVVRT